MIHIQWGPVLIGLCILAVRLLNKDIIEVFKKHISSTYTNKEK